MLLVVTAFAETPVGLMLLLSPSAQVTSATITGTVHDSQGGTMPGALVTLFSETRGTSQITVTTNEGDFTFSDLIINGRQTQLQLRSPTDQTILNSQFNADGSINEARLTPRNAGFGAATSAQALRSAQVQLRFNF